MSPDLGMTEKSLRCFWISTGLAPAGITTGQLPAKAIRNFLPDFPSDSLRESEGKSGSIGNVVFR